MPRFSQKKYQRHAMLAMTLYVGFMLLAWPWVRTTASTPLKVLLALLPVVPMLYMIGLMARRIRDSDELEQRTHLVALGVATAVVGALSLAGGFLASAQVLPLDGTILIWVFPVLMISYGSTRWWVARRYGMSLSCDDDSGMPMYLRFLLVAAVVGALAFVLRHSLRVSGLGMLCGMSGGFAVLGGMLGFARWRARRHSSAEAK